jgi:hypothetical protein
VIEYYLEVVLELESLSAVGTLEPPEDGGLVVGDHVPLQAVHVGELLLADAADLRKREERVIAMGLYGYQWRHLYK